MSASTLQILYQLSPTAIKLRAAHSHVILFLARKHGRICRGAPMCAPMEKASIAANS